MEFKIKNLEDLKNLSNFIKNNYWHQQVFLLTGTLGIGKTQLIKFLLEEETMNPISSPTFNLLNTYTHKIEDIKYFHFDLYKKEEILFWQMEELGLHELLENVNNKCFIEWPERLSFPIEGVEIIFSYENENRIINIKNTRRVL
jgi:tRNA threonylcarbamoyl adenosine modification protein YjeE